MVPPGTGIVHQVNIEHLAQVVFTRDRDGSVLAYPDTCVGTDSHTTMVNGLGVVGWGVGGIEAEAAMLGQPVSMLIPRVVGFKLSGELPEGATATDLVLTITEMLREHGVVGKFVEFYGSGVASVPLANRATIGNMSPEYGSTIAVFPIDDETLNYLRLRAAPTSRSPWSRRTRRSRASGTTPTPSRATPSDSSSTCPPSCRRSPGRSGRRTGSRSPTPSSPSAAVLGEYVGEHDDGDENGYDEASAESFPASDPPAYHGANGSQPPRASVGGDRPRAGPSSPVAGRRSRTAACSRSTTAPSSIAAITSCTNTSNPSVMIGAALLAKNAVDRGLTRKPWVKTTLAPGSKVVTDYYERAGLTPYLEKLGFNLVGYGCTTCIGNSGPLIPEVSAGGQRRATSPSRRCCRATATSRVGSTPTSR